jgi:hypothetical protein
VYSEHQLNQQVNQVLCLGEEPSKQHLLLGVQVCLEVVQLQDLVLAKLQVHQVAHLSLEEWVNNQQLIPPKEVYLEHQQQDRLELLRREAYLELNLQGNLLLEHQHQHLVVVFLDLVQEQIQVKEVLYLLHLLNHRVQVLSQVLQLLQLQHLEVSQLFLMLNNNLVQTKTKCSSISQVFVKKMHMEFLLLKTQEILRKILKKSFLHLRNLQVNNKMSRRANLSSLTI